MGKCFKLFGKTIKNQNIHDCTGSAFFVSEHYMLTCKHTVLAISLNDKLTFQYGDDKYIAELKEVAEDCDLALLYTEDSAQEDWIYSLDRIALEGREAIAYGYPHGHGLDVQRGLEIGTELDNGTAVLTNANGVTIGFSGGPVCPASDTKTAIGIISTIKGEDEYGHQADTAGFVPAHVALDLWGKQYGLREKRFEIRMNAFGSNSFVFSELKTAFQDPEGNLYKLQNFLEDSRPILWWAVTGPGGSGKSRLCYELARSLNSSWRCKLLLVGELEKKNLQALYEDAGRDFLLLADYAYANTYELGEWMYERAHAVDVMDKPRIRVLLLQRETGKEYFGWLESLLRGHGNLIKLRYQPDLKLIAPGPEGTEALMRSYAENEGGRQIDAKALYTVLKKVDPGLTRPLFAMFITDAAINGDNPYRWEPEDALRHFTQREMDVVEREMIVSEHIRATKLLLTLATIVNGFSFDAELLDSSPLREIWELRDLTDKVGFVNKLYNAGLVDRMYGKYIMKPLKPDLLGEYYVLNSFREMMGESQRNETAPMLLHAAKKTDFRETIGFLTRLFNDYDADIEFARICCREHNMFQISVSLGLAMRPNTKMLHKLYREYGTVLWLEQYAMGLYNAIFDQPNPNKAKPMLDELRSLHADFHENDLVAMALTHWLFNAFMKQTEATEALIMLDELRSLYKELPKNTEVEKDYAHTIVNAIVNFSAMVDGNALLDELRAMHNEDPRNIVITKALAKGLSNAIALYPNIMNEDSLLDELRKLYEREYENNSTESIEIAEELARGLYNTSVSQSDPQKIEAMLNEIRLLHVKYSGNLSISLELAKELSIATHHSVDSTAKNALLNELRTLNKNNPGNTLIAEKFANVLFNTLYDQNDLKNACCLLDELRTLYNELMQYVVNELIHTIRNAVSNLSALMDKDDMLHAVCRLIEKQLGGVRISIDYVEGLVDAFNELTSPSITGKLRDEIRTKILEQPGSIGVAETFSKGVRHVIAKFSNGIDINPLLNDLRMLHEDYGINEEIARNYAFSLITVLKDQTDPNKANALLDELHDLHMKQSGTIEVAEAFAKGLIIAITKFSYAFDINLLLNELRRLHDKYKMNYIITVALSDMVYWAFTDHTDLQKDMVLLNELCSLHAEQPMNVAVTEVLANGLAEATCTFTDDELNGLLNELRVLKNENPTDVIIMGAFAKGLFNVFNKQNDALIADSLLDELRALHREQPKDVEIALELAKGLSNATILYPVTMNKRVILNELRALQRELPEDSEIASVLARSLINAISLADDAVNEYALLDELRLIYKNYPGNYNIAGALANGLICYLKNHPYMEIAHSVYEEVYALHLENPENHMVSENLLLLELLLA